MPQTARCSTHWQQGGERWWQALKIRYKLKILNDSRKVHVRHALFVRGPIVAVLLRAPVLITQRPVDDHDGKEGGVEIRQRRIKATRQPPTRGHDPVGEIMRFATEAVPSINQQRAAGFGGGLFSVPQSSWGKVERGT